MDDLELNISTADGTPVYGYRYRTWTHQVYNRPRDRVKKYRKHVLYIVDDIDRVNEGERAQPGEDVHATQHRKVCNLMANTFKNEFITCDVHSVIMRRGQTEKDFAAYIERELIKYGSNDLVCFYFHGAAGGHAKDYTWILRGPGLRKINAFSLIRQANESQTDCLFLLDTFMPDRGNFVKELRKNSKMIGMTEIIIAGANALDPDGRLELGDHNFTESLCRALVRVSQDPKGPPQSFLHALSSDGRLISKPRRIWLNRPRRKPALGYKKCRVRRFVLVPEFVERDGGLDMYSCEIQAPEDKDDSFNPLRGHDESDDDGGGGRGGRGNGGSDDGEDGYGSGEGDGGGGGGGGVGGGNDDDSGTDSGDEGEDDDDDGTQPRSKKRLLSDFFTTRKKTKRQPSPELDFMKDEEEEDNPPIKKEQSQEPELERERSVSPGFEILGSEPRFRFGSSSERGIDLTGDLRVDLTGDDEGEETLFVPLS